MNDDVRQSLIISDRTAASVAVDVRRGDRQERSLWRRYLGFLDSEGIHGSDRNLAMRSEDDGRESEPLFLHALLVLLALAALVLALGSRQRVVPLPALADVPAMEISVAEAPEAPATPLL